MKHDVELDFIEQELGDVIARLIRDVERKRKALINGGVEGVNSGYFKSTLISALALGPVLSYAGDPVTIVNNFVQVLVARFFPVLALGYFAHALMLLIKDDPNAKKSIVNVVLASGFLLGINGVWRFIQSQAN